MPKQSTSSKIKNKVRQFRLKKGVTQNELAMVLNVTRQTIISLEKQKYSPSLSLALRLSRFFGVKVEDLFK